MPGDPGTYPQPAVMVGPMSHNARDAQSHQAEYTPLVSIITPTFQHETFIESCLRSVQAQQYVAWELIVVDDASTDRTAEIVAAYANRDPRIRLIRHHTNYGVSRLSDTYNEALVQSRGELIAVLEGDDEWMPDKLATQVPVFQDAGVVLCYADYDQITADGILIVRHGDPDAITPGRSSPRQNLQYFSLLKSFGSDTVIVRRAPLLRGGGFVSAGLPLVDYPTWLRLAAKGDFVRIPRVLGTWRRHPASVFYAWEYAIMERLEQHFLEYLQEDRKNLIELGLTTAELDALAANAAEAVRQKHRSRHYYEGKYHLLFGRRAKAIGPFGRAIVSPGTPLRHRLGALVGVVAAATSRRVVVFLGGITRKDTASR
jgi:glycosyltransferase involved in cell wall biosynthesis